MRSGITVYRAFEAHSARVAATEADRKHVHRACIESLSCAGHIGGLEVLSLTVPCKFQWFSDCC